MQDIAQHWQQALPPLLLSLKVATWAIGSNLWLGIGFGYLLARKKFWGRELLDTLCTLPMVLPPTVLGYYLLVLVGSRSNLGQWLRSHDIQLIFTWQGAVLAAVVVSFPLIFKPARAAFEQVDRQYEAAAKCLGISNAAVFWRITLPLAWRGILAGILLAFARALGEFGATLMVAGSIPHKTQILSTAIYEAVQAGRDGDAHFLVLVVSLICLAVLLSVSALAGGKVPQDGLK